MGCNLSLLTSPLLSPVWEGGHVCMYYRAAVLNANLTTKLNHVKHEAFASARDVPY